MRLNWSGMLVLAGAVLILVEVALGGFAGFDLVLIGSAFVIGGALGWATGNPALGFIVASALCVVYIAIGRRWVRARIQSRPTASNTDALLGQQGTVLARIAPHEPGQVKLRDEVWRAIPADGVAGPLEPGTVVTVAGVDGVTLHVR